ncbi:uncharacterized protein N7515_001046 [Penicillium bovifimosum]|uniref:Uncharacterized protein n=1 Tax=Penicillium bovifimosum TaxID=126998 RepID=A0A9W9HGI7_9EURO|nr:uncharacterized protein N7515_001046 [Penicillium bovifimosum]KAJ5146482.1 hypothetical protein N7515_001046 [Penicillium bovifimosum]
MEEANVDLTDPPDQKDDFSFPVLATADPRANEFRDRVRQYNAAFAFTSISYTPDQRVSGNYKPLMVAGELFHLYGPLEPSVQESGQEGISPAFAQLWLLEDQQATIPIQATMAL